MIKSIEKSSVHRITSGQVLVDLQTAVKELVENSLDAGATSIEVRFKEHGVKSFEVIDNGSGIAPEDYDSVALKHCTSKISSFEDLTTVQTFGFRGEALSSLCALSERVTVTTATSKEAPMGTVLEFDRTGRVKSKSGKVARQRGTSVFVEGFFAPLAVRRKEFERNAKREFGKALNLLNAYALVPCTKENKGVRLSVVHLQDGGRKSVQMRTDGKPSLRSSISSLWGPKQLESLTELSLDLAVTPERSTLRRQAAGMQDPSPTIVRVRGLISKFSPGNGRAGPDRQFFFINGRPCNPTKIQKTFNEVYRSFDTNQSPFVIADFLLPTDSCDINVSPDKRTILLHSENALVVALKEGIETAFASSRSTFVVQTLAGTQRELVPVKSFRPSAAQQVPAESGDESGDGTVEVEDGDDVPEGPPRIVPPAAESITIPSPVSGSGSEVEERSDTAHSVSHSEHTSAVLPDTLSNSNPLSRVSHSPTSSTTKSQLPSASSSTSTTNSPSTSSSASPATKPPQKPVQMVLSTVNAAWAIRPASEEPALKKRKVEYRSATKVLRTRLASFAAPGSQVVVRQDSDEDGEEEEVEEAEEMSDEEVHDEVDELWDDGTDMVLDKQENGQNLEHETRRSEEIIAISDSDSDPDVDTPLFLPDHIPPELPTDNIEASGQIKSKNDDVIMITGDEGTTLDKERAQHLRSLDQSPSSVDALPDCSSDTSSSIVRSEVLKTTNEGYAVTLQVNTAKIEETWKALSRKNGSALSPKAMSSSKEGKEEIEASAGISNTTDEIGAEQALARLLDKKDFTSMEVLGQFNLGFIIARLRVQKAAASEASTLSQEEQAISEGLNTSGGSAYLDDLFIVDQHAADEKYNFETLQQTTKIASQRLYKPRSLELTAADELVAMENVEVLKSNGFEIEVDEEAGPSQGRVKLVAQPVSGSTTFDMKDLEELLHLMSDRPAGQGMVRCSKARAMFAMRACRKSVMVGMALNKAQMTSVVHHMGTMDQPWNCPHGRPTMRHLASLDTTVGGKTPVREIDWSNL